MSGVKGKSGLRKGITNNPSGRPLGSKNKLSNPVKGILEDIFITHQEQLISDIDKIENPAVRARLLIDIGKLFTPRPVSEQQEEEDHVQSELIKRLFGTE
jgi:hypothetical protein